MFRILSAIVLVVLLELGRIESIEPTKTGTCGSLPKIGTGFVGSNNKACAPFAAAQGIAFVFGRTSNTEECRIAENTGRRGDFVMLQTIARCENVQKSL